MSYRRYFFVLLGLLLGLYTLFFLLVNVVVDPRMELGLFTHSGNQERYKTDILSTQLLLEQLENSPHVLIFGTSRSHMINASVVEGPVLNMHNIYGHPRAVLELLNSLNPRQIANIKQAYYLLDYNTFDIERGYQQVDYSFPLHYRLWELIKNTNLSKLDLAVKTLWANYSGRPAYSHKIDAQGARWQLRSHSFDLDQCETITKDIAEDQSFSPLTVALLGDVDRFFKGHAIDTTYFTVPIFIEALKNMDFDLFQRKNELVLQEVDAVYMGLFEEEYSNNPDFFRDCRHLTQAGLLSFTNKFILLHDPQIRMTRANSAEFFELYSEIMQRDGNY